jgi:hypothetical protein
VGYLSPWIIKYLEPLTGDLLTAQCIDCIFNEEHFWALGGELKYHTECLKINWDALDTLKEDPRTIESELQVQRIINLHIATNNLPDSSTVSKKCHRIIHSCKKCAEKNRDTKQYYSTPFLKIEWEK